MGGGGESMTVGELLKQQRLQKNLTQAKLAELLGVSIKTISNWENGRNYPDIASLITLSNLYSISLDQLVKEDGAVIQDVTKKERQRRRGIRVRWANAMIAVVIAFVLGADLLGIPEFEMSNSVRNVIFVIWLFNIVASHTLAMPRKRM